MKKFWNKIKEFFMKGCENTAEVKDVVISGEENQYPDVVFVKPLEEDKPSFKVIDDVDVYKNTKEESTPKKPKRKYKKKVKSENNN